MTETYILLQNKIYSICSDVQIAYSFFWNTEQCPYWVKISTCFLGHIRVITVISGSRFVKLQQNEVKKDRLVFFKWKTLSRDSICNTHTSNYWRLVVCRNYRNIYNTFSGQSFVWIAKKWCFTFECLQLIFTVEHSIGEIQITKGMFSGDHCTCV